MIECGMIAGRSGIEIDRLKQEIEALKTENNALKAENESLKEKVKDEKFANYSLGETITRASIEASRAKTECVRLKEEVERLKKQILELEEIVREYADRHALSGCDDSVYFVARIAEYFSRERQ